MGALGKARGTLAAVAEEAKDQTRRLITWKTRNQDRSGGGSPIPARRRAESTTRILTEIPRKIYGGVKLVSLVGEVKRKK